MASRKVGAPIGTGRADGDRLPVALVVDFGHRATDVIAMASNGDL